MSDSTSSKSSVALVHTIPGDLVQVQNLTADPLSDARTPLDLREGEVVKCLRNDAYGVLVQRADGGRMLVPPRSAPLIGVRWFPEALQKESPTREGLRRAGRRSLERSDPSQAPARARPRLWHWSGKDTADEAGREPSSAGVEVPANSRVELSGDHAD